MLKALLVSILFIFLGSKAYAYSKDDYVFVAYLCNDIEPLLRIVAEDTRDVSKAGELMKYQFSSGNCVGLRPLELKVKEVIVTYKDANNNKTQLLSLDTGSANSFIVVLVPKGASI
tara:strand:- start:1138 stop:1485 length:348 start_codon:yes stop_codon:yes gene_type:complete